MPKRKNSKFSNGGQFKPKESFKPEDAARGEIYICNACLAVYNANLDKCPNCGVLKSVYYARVTVHPESDIGKAWAAKSKFTCTVTPDASVDVKILPTAPDLLSKATQHMKDRAATYDKPEGERSMGKTVQAFNAITGRDLKESEGWLLLQLLKDVRLFQRPGYHADSAEDCIAYAALKAESKAGEK